MYEQYLFYLHSSKTNVYDQKMLMKRQNQKSKEDEKRKYQ